MIQQQFGVRYHSAHVWKVLTALGWSCQKPQRSAVERDEAAIVRWTLGGMAADKNTPLDVAPISCSSMRAGSRLSRNRIFVRFTDGSGVVRGATSVAVRTQ